MLDKQAVHNDSNLNKKISNNAGGKHTATTEEHLPASSRQAAWPKQEQRNRLQEDAPGPAQSGRHAQQLTRHEGRQGALPSKRVSQEEWMEGLGQIDKLGRKNAMKLSDYSCMYMKMK